MIILLNKFSFILLCLSMLMPYSNGMEPEKKSAKEHEQLLKKPTSDLSADAPPFYPRFSQFVSTGTKAIEQGPGEAHQPYGSLMLPSSMHVGEGMTNLPKDPFEMDSPKSEKSYDDSGILERDATDDHWAAFEQNPELFRQQLQEHIDNLTVQYNSYNPFREGSSSSSNFKKNFNQQKMKEPIVEERKEHRRENRKYAEENPTDIDQRDHQQIEVTNNKLEDEKKNMEMEGNKEQKEQREDSHIVADFEADFPPLKLKGKLANEGAHQNLQNLPKEKENIFLGENEDEGSNEQTSKCGIQVHSNADSWKSKIFDENKFDFEERQDEFPVISSSSHVQSTSLPSEQLLASFPSIMKYKEKLKDAITTSKVEPEQQLKEKEEEKLKQKEMLKGNEGEKLLTKSNETYKTKSPKIGGNKFELPYEDTKQEKEGTSLGKYEISSLIQGKSKTSAKEVNVHRGKDLSQGSPLSPQTLPDGAVVMRSKDKGELIMSGANVKNPFEALWAAIQNERVQFTPYNSSTLSTSTPSSSGASVNKGKEAVGTVDKLKQKEFQKMLDSMIDSNVDSVRKLGNAKAKCMKITNPDERRKANMMLLVDYWEVVNLLEHSSSYRGETDFFLYIGDLFNWMKNAYSSESAIDHKQLTRTMEDCLAYLDENLKDSDTDVMYIDNILKNINKLNHFLVAYEKAAKSRGPKHPDTKQVKDGMIKSYTNHVERQITGLFSFLFIGLIHVKFPPVANAKLSKNNVFTGLLTFSMALPKRKDDFFRAIQTLDKYMEIVQDPGEENQKKSKINRIIEKHFDDVKNIVPEDNREIQIRIKTIFDEIKALEREQQICIRTDGLEKRTSLKRELKRKYQFIMQSLLTSFVRDYGQTKKYNPPEVTFFFTDILIWMAKLCDEKVDGGELIGRMQACVRYLQNDEREEDVINFTQLLKGIDHLIMEAKKCEKLAKSAGGYKDPKTRAALRNLQNWSQQDVLVDRLREAVGYVFIGMGKEDFQRYKGHSITKISMGLLTLGSVAIPKYEQQFTNFAGEMAEFNIILEMASLQEIGDNLAEYIAKILGIDFDQENGDQDFYVLANKIEYPKIYKAGSVAIDELFKQLLEGADKFSNNPTSMKAASAKKGKKKAVEKKVNKTGPVDFGPVNISNWKKVLMDAKKLIRIMNILVKMQLAEEKEDELVFEKKVYLRAWILLFRDELAPMMHEWETIFNQMNQFKKVSVGNIIKFYSDGIFNFVVHECKENEAKKAKKIREALDQLSKLQVQYDMWNRFKNLEKMLNPDQKFDEDGIMNGLTTIGKMLSHVETNA